MINNFRCSENPKRVGHDQVGVPCPNCGHKVKLLSSLPTHLSYCVPELLEAYKNGIRQGENVASTAKKSSVQNRRRRKIKPTTPTTGTVRELTMARNETARIPRCLQCGQTFLKLRHLKGHTFICEKTLEHLPKRACPFCKVEHPEPKSLVHQVICHGNPNRTSSKVDKDINCPKCKMSVKNIKCLRLHLINTCLENFKRLWRKSVDSYQSQGQNASLSLPPSKPGSSSKSRSVLRPLSSGMVGDQAKCLYCERVFRKAFNLWEHSTGCVEITKLEETRKCEFCPKIFPESRSFFHQVQCDRNPARVVKPTDNVTCPKCKRTLPSTRAFRVHLGQKCLPKFKDLVQKSIDSCSKSTTANGDSKTPAATKVQKAKTVITRNRREVGQTTGAKRPGNMKSKPTCLFCGAIFGVPKSLKQHGIRCPEIEKIEKKRDCPHCKKTFAESRSYLHQVVCDLNLGKLPTPTMALNCPKCSSSLKSFLSYQHHLSTTCLQDLVGFFKQSIEKCTQNGRKSSQSQKKNSSAVRDKHDQMGEEISEDVPELAFSSTSESEAENDSDCEIVSYQNFEGRPDLQPIVRLV